MYNCVKKLQGKEKYTVFIINKTEAKLGKGKVSLFSTVTFFYLYLKNIAVASNSNLITGNRLDTGSINPAQVKRLDIRAAFY